MCCRIDPSQPTARIIAGLYILLATFLIGFVVTKATTWIDRTLLDSETAKLLQTVEVPQTPRPNVSEEGPLAIEYLYTQQVLDGGFEAVFEVTNFGPETIRFRNRENNNARGCRLREGRLPGTIRVGSIGCKITTDSLARFDSTYIIVPVEPDDSAYVLSIRYFVDSDGTEQKADLWVKEPHKPGPHDPYPLDIW